MANIIVLFEVIIKEGRMDDYLKRAEHLKELLEAAPGFIRAERFTSLSSKGKLLSMSVWENEESINMWRNLAAHCQSQQAGRMEDFADYTITVVTSTRCYTMNMRKEAPSDSNHYWRLEKEDATYQSLSFTHR